MEMSPEEIGPDIPALVACRREMALAKTPHAQLAAMKRGLAPLGIPVRHGLVDKSIVVDLVFEQAEAIGLLDAIGGDPIAIAIDDALDPHAVEPPLPTGPEDYGTEEPERNSPALDFSTVPLSINAWLERDLPEPDPLLGDWLTTTTRALLVAPTGLGKTNFSMSIGIAVAAGMDFLRWRSHRPRRVLYVDGEMSRRLLKKRLGEAAERLGSAPSTFFALSAEDIEEFAPLNTTEGQATIERVIAHVGGIDLAIFDSVMCLTAGDMKDEESWAQTIPWVRKLTARAIGQLWVHHTGHDETRGYGTKTREWQLDTVAVLESIKRDDADVSFRLEFKKARERTPETRTDFAPLKVWLTDDWSWSGDDGAGRSSRRLSDRDRLSIDALTDCALEHGKPPPPSFGLPTGMSTITLDQWRKELFTRGVLDRDASNPREDFRRIRSRLAVRKLIGEMDGLVWRAA